jgi:hypothetical protein
VDGWFLVCYVELSWPLLAWCLLGFRICHYGRRAVHTVTNGRYERYVQYVCTVGSR